MNTKQVLQERDSLQIELNVLNENLRRSQEAFGAARDHYSDFYDIAPVGYCTVNDAGLIIQANLVIANMLGTPRKTLEQQELTRFIFPDDQDVYYFMRQRLKDGNAQQTCELRMTKVGSEPFWVQLLALLIPQTDAKPVLRIVLIDITDRKHNEVVFAQYRHHLEEMVEIRTAELVRVRHAAEAAKLAKSVFLGHVGQEMRSPLKAILECARRLRDDFETDKDQRPDIDLICRNSDQLLNVISELLDMARIEAGRMETESLRFDLREMLQQIIDQMQPHAMEKGLALRVDARSMFPQYVYCDEKKLCQVLTKLIDKAVQANVQGDINVRVGTGDDQAHQQQLSIEIWRGGNDAPLTDHDNATGPLQQPGPQDLVGNGLGMLVSKGLIQLMGGRISVQTTPSEGSLFHVELPLSPPMQSPSFVDKFENERVIGLAPDQREYRILIVEDQIEASRLLTDILDFSGLDVRVANNGEQGVSFFSEWNPHLIFMSLSMPAMDGLATTQKIRLLSKGLPVKIVGIIASDDHERPDTLMAAGIDSVVDKPYEFEAIFGALKTHLGIRFLYEDARIGH